MEISGTVKIIDAKIVAVEKGNADKNVEKPVCAFTVNTSEGHSVKALLKYELAKTTWEHFLKERLTVSEVIPSGVSTGLQIRKEVFVTFSGHFRELRKNEIVIDNLSELQFNFKYGVEVKPSEANASSDIASSEVNDVIRYLSTVISGN